MARAETRTLLSLDRFAKILGAHPLHWNGIVHDLAPATTCGQPILQYDWQVVDGISRESIAHAIKDAEDRISQYLGYKPLPVFEIDERHSTQRLNDPSLIAARLMTPMGFGMSTQLDWGHVVAGGIERRTPITLNAPIVYTDEDGDGYAETAKLVVSTSVTDLNEVCLFLPGESAAPEWEVRPIKVAITGGVATITTRREQLVIPDLMERLDSTRAIDGTDNGNFLTTADVYRIWHDPSQQVQFLWENQFGTCGCNTNTCATCFLSAQFGCTVVRDYRLGLIAGQPALWNDATQAYEFTTYGVARAPDRARYWYRAGYRDQTRQRPMHEMDARWERAIAAFAITFLDRPFCGCRNVENISNYWGKDLAESNTNETTNRLSNKWLDNPFGTTQGALHAWRLVRSEALGASA